MSKKILKRKSKQTEKADYEPIKRFCIIPLAYETPGGYYHCNTKRVWQVFLINHFSKFLDEEVIDYTKAISNAAFRLSGLEMKVGLLLAHDEGARSKKKFLSGAIQPSIIIDSALALFSILEGLSYLSFLTSVERAVAELEVKKKDRGDKIAKGLKVLLKRDVKKEIRSLRELRDRCIHQDCADQKDDLDYAHVFSPAALKVFCGMLYDFLYAMEDENMMMPSTNFNEFYLQES